MKRIAAWVLCLVPVLCCGSLWAAPSDACWSHGVEAIGEFLYIRPTLCDLNYVIVDDRAVTDIATLPALLPCGAKQGQCLDYHAAFRAGGAYVFNDGCNDLTVTYTGLWDRNKVEEELPVDSRMGLWATFGHPRYMSRRLNGRAILTNPTDEQDQLAIAEHHLRIAYSMIDATAAIRRMEACNLLIRRYIGIRWTDISVRRTADYAGYSTSDGTNFSLETHKVHQNDQVWGIGPRVGADLRWCLVCGFGVGAHVGASILVGEGTLYLEQKDTITPLNGGAAVDEPLLVQERQRCHLMPELDARLGFNYLWCCGKCLSLFVEVGYQFETYINAIHDLRFNDLGGTARTVCQPFNLDGIYVHFALGF